MDHSYYARCEACGLEWLTLVPRSVLSAHESRHSDYPCQTVWLFTQRDEVTS